MKTKTLLFILCLTVFLLPQTKQKTNTPAINDEINLNDIRSKISYNLEKLERDYLTKLSYRDYSRAKDILIETYNLLLAIPIVTFEEPAHIMPMSDFEFKELYNNVENESFESDKLSILSISSNYNLFSVKQILQILSLFSFSESKIESVRILFPNVIDKQNSHLIISSFTHSSDKERVRKIIDSIY